MCIGKRKIEGGASIHYALGPDPAAMAGHNALNRGQSDTGTLECFWEVQALEHAEQFVHVFHVKTHAIVSDEHHDLILISAYACHLDLGLPPSAREFDGVGKEIDQRKSQHRAVAMQTGQCADFPHDIAPVGLPPDFFYDVIYDFPHADQCVLRLGSSYS